MDRWSQWPWLSYSCNKMQVAFNQVGMQRMHKTEAKGKSMRSSHRCYRKKYIYLISYIIFITELFFHISKMNRAISRVLRKLAFFLLWFLRNAVWEGYLLFLDDNIYPASEEVIPTDSLWPLCWLLFCNMTLLYVYVP